jgi:hypothetical protein
VDLFDVVRACFRRWYVVLPILLITGWYVSGVYASIKPLYYSQGVVGLASPSQVQYTPGGDVVARNGLLDAGGPTLIANMVVFQMREPQVVNEVVAAGGRPDYGVKMFATPAAAAQIPLIMIDAGEPSPHSAATTVDLAAAQVDGALRAVQQHAGVPDAQMVRGFVVSASSEPVEAMPSRTRTTIVMSAAGAGLAILVAVVVDVVLMRWKMRRQTRRQIDSEAVDAANSIDAAQPPDDTGKVPSNAHAAADIQLDRS